MSLFFKKLLHKMLYGLIFLGLSINRVLRCLRMLSEYDLRSRSLIIRMRKQWGGVIIRCKSGASFLITIVVVLWLFLRFFSLSYSSCSLIFKLVKYAVSFCICGESLDLGKSGFFNIRFVILGAKHSLVM